MEPVARVAAGEIVSEGIVAAVLQIARHQLAPDHSSVLANLARLDLHAAAARLEAPWLLLHGRADETVPFAEAESLLAAASKGSARLHAIEGGGHTFGAAHPFAGPTPHLAEAAAATVAHLRAALAG